MRKCKTLLRQLEQVLESKTGQEAYKRLTKIVEELRQYIQFHEERAERYGKSIQHLMGWYIKLWNGTPPESFGYSKWQDRVGKALRELIQIYEQNGLGVEDIKKDYEEFRRLKEGYLKGDGSITWFRTVLPRIKRTHRESGKWVTPENTRGLDYYMDDIDDMPDWAEEG
jgi:uncharacterized protein YukE